MKQTLFFSALAVSTLTASVLAPLEQAQAFTFSADLNPSTSISSNAPPYQPGGSHTGASGLLKFTFSQFSSTQVLLDLLITNTTNQNTSDGLGATASSLTDVYFDLPSIVALSTYTGSTVFPNFLSPSDPYQPFTNNPPPGYPSGPFDVQLSYPGKDPSNGLDEGESTLVKLLFNTSKTAQEVEAAFHWGFFNANGTSYIPSEPLRLALRFQAVDGPGFTGASEKLLAKPEAIPAPALLPALLGFGVSVLRKKKQAEQEPSV